MRKNVTERLANLELVSGQWRERVSEATAKRAERLDEYVASVKERAARMTGSAPEEPQTTEEPGASNAPEKHEATEAPKAATDGETSPADE